MRAKFVVYAISMVQRSARGRCPVFRTGSRPGCSGFRTRPADGASASRCGMPITPLNRARIAPPRRALNSRRRRSVASLSRAALGRRCQRAAPSGPAARCRMATGRIVGGIQVEHDLPGRLAVRVEEQLDQGPLDRGAIMPDPALAVAHPEAAGRLEDPGHRRRAVLQPVQRALDGARRIPTVPRLEPPEHHAHDRPHGGNSGRSSS